jgi:hypothetical protein
MFSVGRVRSLLIPFYESCGGIKSFAFPIGTLRQHPQPPTAAEESPPLLDRLARERRRFRGSSCQ